MLIPARGVFSQDSLVKPASSTSSSAIKSKVIYNSLDSVRFDVINQKVFLYKDATVKYEDMDLKAEYIEFDMLNNVAYARGGRDSAGNVTLDSAGFPVGDPVFSEGEKSFEAKEITYNFQTKKGKIKEVTTQEGEGFIHAKDAKKDSTDVYYVKNGKYTTCDLEHPHFYLNASKLKIIPDDRIICGPANLVIADVPTPLGIPFGVFPNKRGRKSGILIPMYGQSELGFFLKDGGIYFGISDYLDLALRGDIYSLGSYGVKSHTNYSKRYGYTGSLGLGYASIRVGEKGDTDFKESKDYIVRWTHMQDAKANPTIRFSANVNVLSNSYQTYNSNTANEYLSNTFSSNVAWNKSWQGSPFNLAVNMAHTQNTISRVVDVTLPEATLSMSRQYWFKRRVHKGKQNIFEKIGIGATLSAKNHITEYDSLIFKNNDTIQPFWKKFNNGLRVNIPISTSTNIGPVIATLSGNFTAYGYFETLRKHFDFSDSTVDVDTFKVFSVPWDFNYSVSLSTKYYMMYLYKSRNPKGPAIKAIRHVLTPSASLSLRPDFSQGYYHYYQTTITGDSALYSIFQNGFYGSPANGKYGFVNFALNNNLEMKLRHAKKDSAGEDRKVVLIENFGLNSSYNIEAESFNLSNINLSARTRLFKVVDLTMSGIIDPYAYDTALGRRINRFEMDVTGKLGRLTSAIFSLSTSLRSLVKKPVKATTIKQSSKMTKRDEDELKYIQTHPGYYVDFNVPWNLSVYYNVIYSKPILEDTVIQTLTFSGDVSITKKWKIGFHSGIDFVKKDFTYTSFNIYRDLHCWEMRLDWIPFGLRKSYMLSIAVKASVLQDLKLSRKRDWYDYN